MFFNEHLHMDMPVLVDQQELICISSVRMQEVIQKTDWERWMLSMDGERVSQENLYCKSNLMMIVGLFFGVGPSGVSAIYKLLTNIYRLAHHQQQQ